MFENNIRSPYVFCCSDTVDTGDSGLRVLTLLHLRLHWSLGYLVATGKCQVRANFVDDAL